MPTFLTTPKMSPELADRVETAVTGRPAGRGKMSPRAIAALRFGGLAGAIALVVWILVVRRQANDALEAERQSLFAQLDKYASQVTKEDRDRLTALETWAAKHSDAYEGDLIDDSVRGPGMAVVLTRPILYLRGPIAGFRSTAGMWEMQDTTYRDAFVLCLMDPPASRTEKLLREAARAAQTGSERTKAVGHVQRFHAARAGLPFFTPEWADRIRRAETTRDFVELRKRLERMPLDESVQAIKSKMALLVMDEPKEGTAPTEIDGANRHHVRVIIFDMETEAVLLRLRRLVDPEWIAVARRGQYANGMNSCELSMEVRAAMMGTEPPKRE